MNNLNEEFEGVELSKRDYKNLTKRILKNYHRKHSFTMPNRPKNTSLVKYDFNKVKEIYEVTPEITEEMIADEFRNTDGYKKMQEKRELSEEELKEDVKDTKNSLLARVLGGIFVTLFIACIGLCTYDVSKDAESEFKFRNLYRQKLI